MERILSSNERVRRAEEIYARRQNVRERTKKATVNVTEPKNFKLLKRVILQIVICGLIYFIFYLINTTNYDFSKITIEKMEELLSIDTDFAKIYNDISNNIGSYLEILNVEEKVQEENNISQNNVEGEVQNEEIKNEIGEVPNSKEVETSQESETTGEEKLSDVNVSETDRIKAIYPFALPLSRKNHIRIWRKGEHIKYSIYIPQRNRYIWKYWYRYKCCDRWKGNYI